MIKAMLYMGQRVSDTRTMRKANVKDNWLEITPDEYKTDIYHRVVSIRIRRPSSKQRDILLFKAI